MTEPGRLAEALRPRLEGSVTVGAPLSAVTTFRVGGPADLLVEAESVSDLVAVAEVVQGRLPLAVVGKGSNMLVADDGFRGLVVRLGKGFRMQERTEDGFIFGGAEMLPAAARATAAAGMTGFEWAAEVPGTFGGGVRMNAGAHGRSMADVLVWADVVDLSTGEHLRLDAEDLGYGYRHSDLRDRDVVCAGRVRLETGASPEAVSATITGYLDWRREHQPSGRNCGSVFKNPPGDSAGRLIDEAGLKGHRVGGAEVSSVHANFIVVDRDATALDTYRLIRRVHRLVLDRTGVDLGCEVRFLGAFPQVDDEIEGELEG